MDVLSKNKPDGYSPLGIYLISVYFIIFSFNLSSIITERSAEYTLGVGEHLLLATGTLTAIGTGIAVWQHRRIGVYLGALLGISQVFVGVYYAIEGGLVYGPIFNWQGAPTLIPTGLWIVAGTLAIVYLFSNQQLFHPQPGDEQTNPDSSGEETV